MLRIAAAARCGSSSGCGCFPRCLGGHRHREGLLSRQQTYLLPENIYMIRLPESGEEGVRYLETVALTTTTYGDMSARSSNWRGGKTGCWAERSPSYLRFASLRAPYGC